MSEQNRQVAIRLRELRETRGLTIESFAKQVGVAVDVCAEYEKGDTDIPIGFLCEAAQVLKSDLTTIVTGRSPRLRTYSFVKGGEGLTVESFHNYNYKTLAHKFTGKKAEPMLVEMQPENTDEPIALNTHPGQEIDYVLEGELFVQLGDKQIIMKPGDTLYHDSGVPHGMRPAGDQPVKFLAIVL